MNRYPLRPLRDVLTPALDEVLVLPDVEYQPVGLYSFGRGAFHKEPMLGANTSYKSLLRIHSGHFIVSRLKAFEGAVAVVDSRFEGCVASKEFPTFSVRRAVGEPSYLAWICRWSPFWKLLGERSKGVGARRERIDVHELLEVCVPLPDPAEQRRVAGVLDRIGSGVSRIESVNSHFRSVASTVSVAAAHRADLSDETKRSRGWSRVRLGDALVPAGIKTTVEPDRVYPNFGILSFGRGTFEKTPISGANTSARALFRVTAGQFIYSRLFAFEGAYSYVPRRFGGYYVSNEFPVFDCDEESVTAEFLAACFRSPSVWADLATASTGLGLRRQRVQPDRLLSYTVWLPPLAEQVRLRRVLEATSRLETMSLARRERLQALMAVVLNCAFAGEL